jgi:hypothetical protein
MAWVQARSASRSVVSIVKVVATAERPSRRSIRITHGLNVNPARSGFLITRLEGTIHFGGQAFPARMESSHLREGTAHDGAGAGTIFWWSGDLKKLLSPGDTVDFEIRIDLQDGATLRKRYSRLTIEDLPTSEELAQLMQSDS